MNTQGKFTRNLHNPGQLCPWACGSSIQQEPEELLGGGGRHL